MSLINDIDNAVKAVCPIHGLAMDGGIVIRVDFKDEATPEERLAAQAVVDSFDTSTSAQEVRDKATADTAVQAKLDELLPLMVTVMKAAGLDVPSAAEVKAAVPDIIAAEPVEIPVKG